MSLPSCHPLVKGHISSACGMPQKPKSCYVCNEEGHISRECPQNENAGGAGFGSGPACYQCGKPGHIARNCRSGGGAGFGGGAFGGAPKQW